MNGLILSCGSRNKIVEYFIKETPPEGKIVTADCDMFAPALYLGNKHYIIPKFSSDDYIDTVLDICFKENITYVFSLIDTELVVLSKLKKFFSEKGIKIIVSENDFTEKCLNKKEIYKDFIEKKIPTQKSYFDIEHLISDLNKNIIQFPLFVKPIMGSASINVSKIETSEELLFTYERNNGLFVQEFMAGEEYGVDCYVDIHSHKVIDMFIKKKIRMRAGETDKSISVLNNEISNLIVSALEKFEGIEGMLDIDVFEKDGNFYISEINPRFGGGYPHAYESGINFPKYLLENLAGKIHPEFKNLHYRNNIVMMKYNDILIKKI